MDKCSHSEPTQLVPQSMPAYEPAPPRPVDRIGLDYFVFDDLSMVEIGPNPGRGLLIASQVGEALGYADRSFKNRLGGDWSNDLVFEEWRTSPGNLQSAIDAAESMGVHLIKVVDEMLRDFKEFDQAQNLCLVKSRTSHLYLVTRGGLFHICDRLSRKPKAKAFQHFMTTRGRRALETGQALSHDASGTELPPPVEPAKLAHDQPLTDRERINLVDLVLSFSTIDRAEREHFVMELLRQGTGISPPSQQLPAPTVRAGDRRLKMLPAGRRVDHPGRRAGG